MHAACRGYMQAEETGSMHEGIYMNTDDGRHRGGGEGRKEEEERGKEEQGRCMQREEEERGVMRMQTAEEGRRREEACRGSMQRRHAEGTVHEGKLRGCMQRRHAKDAGSMHEGRYMYDHDGTLSGGGKGTKEEERGGMRKP